MGCRNELYESASAMSGGLASCAIRDIMPLAVCTSNVPAALPTSVFRFQQPQPHNGEALPQQCWVSLPGCGSGDQLHHGLQEQLLVLCAGEHLPEGEPQGAPHGPDQGSEERLNRLSPASQGLLGSGKRAAFTPEGRSQEFCTARPFAQPFAQPGPLHSQPLRTAICCICPDAGLFEYRRCPRIVYVERHSNISLLHQIRGFISAEQSNGWRVSNRSADALLLHGQQVVCMSAHLGLRPTGRMGASNKPFWVL